ncbi:hypothetical protein EON65_18885 [archaeon]|nr:MAG: hypothetical protein EON65_18885 [archaeon]
MVGHISVKRALQTYPDAAKTSLAAGLRQMLDKDVFQGHLYSTLIREPVQSIVPSFVFLKEKNTPDGKLNMLKARIVVGSNWQDKELYENASSPNAHLSSVFIVAGIAAKEGREAVTLDVAGAHLNTPITNVEVFVRLNQY